jgi:hypothetical protein
LASVPAIDIEGRGLKLPAVMVRITRVDQRTVVVARTLPAKRTIDNKAIRMPKNVVQCCHGNCEAPAAYKIAARWSDGRSAELKTYGFACSEHIGPVFRDSEQRRQEYTPSPGEVIEEIAIYRYEPAKRDRLLQRLWGLEENYRS